MAKIIVSKKITTYAKNQLTRLIDAGYSLCGDVKSKNGELKALVYKNTEKDLELVFVDKEYQSKKANSLNLTKIKNAVKAPMDFVKKEVNKLQDYIKGQDKKSEQADGMTL